MIDKNSIAKLADVLEATLYQPPTSEGTIDVNVVEPAGVSTDTRTIQPNDLFVALTGPNFDGHAFVKQAKAVGAVAALVSKPVDVDLPQVIVKDTLAALGQLAAYHRQHFQGKVAAITGSSGKTTVKELSSHILRCSGDVWFTQGNLNNHIGAPLTLLKLEDAHAYGVIELGASQQGDIAYTVALTRPDVATITNAGHAHIEGFGSLEGVVKAKGEIIDGLGDDGTFVLNIDDDYSDVWAARAQPRTCLSFSLKEDAGADFFPRKIEMQQDGSSCFEMVTPVGFISIQLPLFGRHNIANALNAAAIAYAMGCQLADIKQGLECAAPVKGRLARIDSPQGWTVIDDTYNANPSSMKAAINVLKHLGGTTVFVMGQMGELAEEAEQAHQTIGLYAKDQGIQRFMAVGDLTKPAVNAFGEEGQWFGSQDELVAALRTLLSSGTNILVKGSRSAGMEKVINALVEEVEE